MDALGVLLYSSPFVESVCWLSHEICWGRVYVPGMVWGSTGDIFNLQKFEVEKSATCLSSYKWLMNMIEDA